MMYGLHELAEFWGPLRVFEYISVRTAGAGASAFLMALFIGKPVIAALRSFKIGQNVRDDEVLASHRVKQGTPTMGGVIIIFPVALMTLLWTRTDSIQVVLAVCTMLWMGAIGFVDDYIKIVKKRSEGLSARGKLLLQSVWIVLFMLLLRTDGGAWDYARQVMVPFVKDPVFQDIGLIGTFVFVYLVLVGTCNAVNLTDGMDGLATGCMNSAAVAYMVMAYVAGRVDFSQYLAIPYIPGAGELAVFCGALVGAGLGFLWYNCYPAQVFMGDTGSLALGGALASVAILVKQELALVIVGGIFFVEALSVMLQVGRYKLTGKRFFRCAPIHHHFEIITRERFKAEGREGVPVESLVTARFWICSIIFAMIGVATLKIR